MKIERKNKLLLIGFISLLFLVYQFGLSRTFEVIEKKNTLSNDMALSVNIPGQIKNLSVENEFYKQTFEKLSIGGSSIQNGLLEFVNQNTTTNLKLIEFKNPHVFKNENQTEYTYRFTLQGGYNHIENLLYKLEQQTQFGEIIGIEMETIKNLRKKNKTLTASVLLRSYQ